MNLTHPYDATLLTRHFLQWFLSSTLFLNILFFISRSMPVLKCSLFVFVCLFNLHLAAFSMRKLNIWKCRTFYAVFINEMLICYMTHFLLSSNQWSRLIFCENNSLQIYTWELLVDGMFLLLEWVFQQNWTIKMDWLHPPTYTIYTIHLG